MVGTSFWCPFGEGHHLCKVRIDSSCSVFLQWSKKSYKTCIKLYQVQTTGCFMLRVTSLYPIMSMEWLRVGSVVKWAKTSVSNSYFCGEKNWWFPHNVLYNYYINLTVPNVPTNKKQRLHVLASCCIHVLPELPIWRQPSLQQHFIESWWSLAGSRKL